MNKRLFATIAVLAAVAAGTAYAADVGVSVSIGEPGFYGQIDIGNYPQPRVIYRQPVLVERGPDYDSRPIYLRVPPGYTKHWSRHCAEYRACGRRVYFVRDDWYNTVYAPRYRKDHGRGRGHGDEGHGHEDHGHGDHGHGDHGHGHGGRDD
ncbi:MAG: hypothetical protein KGJ55_00850 [Gammaproteobacteria bacterium]|nr:hypothetical protein [Gammaproteobacteria bacterium]